MDQQVSYCIYKYLLVQFCEEQTENTALLLTPCECHISPCKTSGMESLRVARAVAEENVDPLRFGKDKIVEKVFEAKSVIRFFNAC